MTQAVAQLWKNEGGGFGIERGRIPAPRCYLCGVAAEFNEATHRWGFAKCCRACRREHRNRLQQRWRHAHRELCREYTRRYRDRQRETNRRCRARNPEKYRARVRAWQHRNKAYFKAWKYDHPDRWARYMARAKAKAISKRQERAA